MKTKGRPCNITELRRRHSGNLKRLWLRAFVVVWGMAGVLPARADYSPPSAGLVAWWRANGDATDSSGTGHNGVLGGGMGFTTGVYGQAFSSSAGKRVFVPDSTAFYLTSLTIGAWANPSDFGYNILTRGDNRSGLDPYNLGMDQANGKCSFGIYDSTGALALLETPAAMAFSQWHQYTATLDGAPHDMRIYVDGILAAERTTTLTPIQALDLSQVPGIGIGNTPNIYDFPWNGGLDEVVLYNRALSPGEVASLVPEPTGLFILFAGGVLSVWARRSRSN